MTYDHDHRHGVTDEPGEEYSAERLTQEYWDARYRTKSSLWSGKPNPSLVSETSGLTPGTALEAGAGEGADAIWLARQGWKVTAVDVSAVALERAAAHAADAGPAIAERLCWERRDMLEWQLPRRSFDLVTAHFIHVPSGLRPQLYRRLATEEWEVVTNTAVPREAKDPDGNMVTIHDTVFRARRKA
jgi:2-polyprenyl-3-methyl-5-hydroxy-6-metoxy-1,4-benzoquinol methylase